jgi:hypothetical protein
VCIVRISGKNSNFFYLYDINCVLFPTETDCVYCAIRTESVNIVQVNVGLCLAVLRQIVAGLSP